MLSSPISKGPRRSLRLLGTGGDKKSEARRVRLMVDLFVENERVVIDLSGEEEEEEPRSTDDVVEDATEQALPSDQPQSDAALHQNATANEDTRDEGDHTPEVECEDLPLSEDECEDDDTIQLGDATQAANKPGVVRVILTTALLSALGVASAGSALFVYKIHTATFGA